MLMGPIPDREKAMESVYKSLIEYVNAGPGSCPSYRASVMPVGARRDLMNLPDDLWTKVNIEFYRDGEDGVFKVFE